MKDIDISIGPRLENILDPFTLCQVLTLRTALSEIYYRDLKYAIEKGIMNAKSRNISCDTEMLSKLTALQLNKEAFDLAIGMHLAELSKEESKC